MSNFNEPEDAPPPLPRYVKDGATYVSCFSEQPDQLSQWRAYGGRGYAVGFTRAGLGNLEIDGEDAPFKPAGQVVQEGYGEPAIDDLCQRVANYFARPDFLSLPRPSGLLDAVSFVLPALARLKHEAFKDELEWRVTVSRYARGPAKKLYFREGVRLVPYLKLRFDPSAVAWVSSARARTSTTKERCVDFWRPINTTLTVCGSSDRRLHFEVVRAVCDWHDVPPAVEGVGAKRTSRAPAPARAADCTPRSTPARR